MMRILHANILIGLALLITGCSAWRADFYQAELTPDKNVRFYDEQITNQAVTPTWVLVVADIEDDFYRAQFEQDYIDQLAQLGIKALPGSRIAPAYTEPYFSKRMFKVKAERLNISHVLYVGQVEHYVQQLPRGFEAGQGFNTSYSYGYTPDFRYSRRYDPGFMDRARHNAFAAEETDVLLLDTQMTDAVSGKVLWGAKSETFLLGHADQQIRNIIQQHIDRIRKAQFLI